MGAVDGCLGVPHAQRALGSAECRAILHRRRATRHDDPGAEAGLMATKPSISLQDFVK